MQIAEVLAAARQTIIFGLQLFYLQQKVLCFGIVAVVFFSFSFSFFCFLGILYWRMSRNVVIIYACMRRRRKKISFHFPLTSKAISDVLSSISGGKAICYYLKLFFHYDVVLLY